MRKYRQPVTSPVNSENERVCASAGTGRGAGAADPAAVDGEHDTCFRRRSTWYRLCGWCQPLVVAYGFRRTSDGATRCFSQHSAVVVHLGDHLFNRYVLRGDSCLSSAEARTYGIAQRWSRAEK